MMVALVLERSRWVADAVGLGKLFVLSMSVHTAAVLLHDRFVVHRFSLHLNLAARLVGLFAIDDIAALVDPIVDE